MRGPVLVVLASALFLSSCEENRAGTFGSACPESPTLEARADGASASLSWHADPCGVDSIELERSLGDTLHFLPMRRFAPRDTAWSDTFATNDVVRWYRLLALDGSVIVARSNPASCRPQPRTPTDSVKTWRSGLAGAPPGLRAEADSFQVVLRWSDSAPSGVDGYLLERSRGDSQHFADLAEIPRGIATWNDASAKTADTFWYRIRLRDGDSVSKPSAPVACAPLTRPTPLAIRRDGARTDSVVVPWGTTLVVVEVDNGGDDDLWIDRIVPDRSWLSASMDDSGVEARGTRLLRIDIDTNAIRDGSVHAGAIELVASTGVAIRLAVSVAPPRSELADPDLRVDSVGTDRVALAWSLEAQPRLRFRVVQRALGDDGAFEDADTLFDPKSAGWIDSGLASNRSLRYRLLLRDSIGDSLVSGIVTARTAARTSLTACLVDSSGASLQGAVSSVSGSLFSSTDARGCATFAEPTAIDTAWIVGAEGRLGRRMSWRRPEKADTMYVALDPLEDPVDLLQPEGTDFFGAALAGDTVWVVDRDASGSALLLGFVPGGPARFVRRTLGQIMTVGTPGPLAKAGSHLAATFPVDGSVAIASTKTAAVRRVVLPDSVGSPWGIAGCPDGRFAVAASAGVAILDSAGALLEVRKIETVVDDVGATHGARIACTAEWIYLADDGGPNGFVLLDRSSGLFAKVGLRPPSTPRFVATIAGRVVVGTAMSAKGSVQHLDQEAASTSFGDLTGFEITALAAATDRFGAPISVVALAEGSKGRLLLHDFRGGLLGSIALEKQPVEMVAQGGRIVLVYPDHLATMRLHGD